MSLRAAGQAEPPRSEPSWSEPSRADPSSAEPSGIGWRGYAGLFALAVGLDLLISLGMARTLRADGLINPDSFMRLVRLRDEIAAGRLTDMVMADGSGQGVLLHWSHLLDGVIFLLWAPLRLALPAEPALRWAGSLIGPLSAGLLGIAVVWAGAPLTRGRWAWLGVVLAGVAPLVAAYAVLGCAHHHVLAAACVAAMAGCAARLVRSDTAPAPARRVAAGLGVCVGLGIWLTPETMPFALMAFGALGLQWLLADRPGPIGVRMLITSIAAFATIVGSWLIDPHCVGAASR